MEFPTLYQLNLEDSEGRVLETQIFGNLFAAYEWAASIYCGCLLDWDTIFINVMKYDSWDYRYEENGSYIYLRMSEQDKDYVLKVASRQIKV